MESRTQATNARSRARVPAAVDGEAWKWVRIPAALHEEYKVMAGQEQRSIAGQIIWVLQDALRRERAQKRRHTDQVPETTKRRARGAA